MSDLSVKSLWGESWGRKWHTRLYFLFYIMSEKTIVISLVFCLRQVSCFHSVPLPVLAESAQLYRSVAITTGRGFPGVRWWLVELFPHQQEMFKARQTQVTWQAVRFLSQMWMVCQFPQKPTCLPLSTLLCLILEIFAAILVELHSSNPGHRKWDIIKNH